ncbi:MAG: hypothetical protein KAR45_03560 [Desulfobacteraceae bacterium]|nr:hypothetical protein [Desulfobacteraceae bacterium]
MKKLQKTLKILGQIWTWIAVAWIISSYCFNLIFSDAPIPQRIFVFMNFWYVLIVILMFFPGYLLIEASEKISKRYGYSFEKNNDKSKSYVGAFLSNLFSSKKILCLVVVVYLIGMITFLISQNS